MPDDPRKRPEGLDDETLPSATELTSTDVRVPCLTVVAHPDAARIGERCRLTELAFGRQVAVSRLTPDFHPPHGADAHPLADRGVSRQAWHLVPEPNASFRIEPPPPGVSVTVGGEPFVAAIRPTPAELAEGMLIGLGDRVILLLHRVGPPRPAREAHGLIGASEGIQKVRADIERVADLDIPVLLRGETGSGKELVARAIHDGSKRARQPFVAVNMATLGPSTAASELFGHVRGAFTGANRDQGGLFLQANGGTIFLDEIGEAPGDVQPMLLRALDAGEIRPLGATTTRRVDVRVISATDADLEGATAGGSFRLPLLQRLSGFTLNVPPLRERRDDIARLFFHFLREALQETGEAHVLLPPAPGVAPWVPTSLMARLLTFSWPGNVRQLRNVARQLAISSRGLAQLRMDGVVEALLREIPAPPTGEVPAIQEVAPTPARAAATGSRTPPAEITEEQLIATLRRHRFGMAATASDLGISRTSLYALVEKSDRIRKAGELTIEEIEAAVAAQDGDLQAAADELMVSLRGLKLRAKALGLEF